MVDHLVEARQARLERFLAILIEEELRVSEPRAHDALVALDHRARIVGPDVADDEELVGQRRRGIEQRKVLLVGLHRQDQALRRHVEELRLELAQQHVGPLDQRSHFIEQRVVVDRLELELIGRVLQLTHDLGTPMRESRDHRALLLQLLNVVIGMLHTDRLDTGFEAVAERVTARFKPSACTGTTSAPCSATNPCTGRTNCTLVQPSASW